MVISLGVALAITPATRRIYRDPRMLLVLVGAALPMLPFLLWLANLDPDLISRRAAPPGSGLSAALSLQGALVFITGIPLVFLPWIAGLTAITMLAVMAALLLFAMATGSALFGITRFAIHYLFPFSLFGAGALRPRGATHDRGAICAEACHYLARNRPRHLPGQAR